MEEKRQRDLGPFKLIESRYYQIHSGVEMHLSNITNIIYVISNIKRIKI